MRVVVKSGGTSLDSDGRIDRAASSTAVAVEHGYEIAIVAPAVGLTIDDLLDEVKFEADDRNCVEIVSMGERANVRMLKAVLAACGVNALLVESGTDERPVTTSDLGEVDVEATRERAAKPVAELDGVVPIITDFLAQNHDDEITMLGRGGSDTSAVMLGNYVDAGEVVAMTDVEGVMTGDPCVVEGARNVGRITVGEPRSLSLHGIEVVVSSTLSCKDMTLDVHVVRYRHGGLLTGGTLVKGEFHNLTDVQEEPLARFTVAGRAVCNRPGILADLPAALREENINVDLAVSGVDSITLYVLEDDSGRAEAVLCGHVITDDALSSATVEDDTAVVRVTSGEFSNRPDATLGIIGPLSEAGINIHDATISATSVVIFVVWGDREETLGIIQGKF